jgi:protein-S-isoprenylcysteine O-methyltransferase Ste14
LRSVNDARQNWLAGKFYSAGESNHLMDLRQRLFQNRSYTPIPFLVVMIIFADPTPVSLAAGFCLVAGGEFLRLWGVAIAGSETRTTGPVGGTFLITCGPFAFVRNPLYVGNMMIYFGVGVMSYALFPWFSLIAVCYFAWQYSQIVSLEEEHLAGAFGDEYRRYCLAVPRFIPRFTSYQRGDNPQPELDWSRGLKSEMRTLQAIGLLTLTLSFLYWWRK